MSHPLNALIDQKTSRYCRRICDTRSDMFCVKANRWRQVQDVHTPFDTEHDYMLEHYFL